MSKQTETLNLFEYDTEKDKKQTFNIDKALNDNFDKIDKFAENELVSGVYFEEYDDETVIVEETT